MSSHVGKREFDPRQRKLSHSSPVIHTVSKRKDVRPRWGPFEMSFGLFFRFCAKCGLVRWPDQRCSVKSPRIWHRTRTKLRNFVSVRSANRHVVRDNQTKRDSFCKPFFSFFSFFGFVDKRPAQNELGKTVLQVTHWQNLWHLTIALCYMLLS